MNKKKNGLVIGIIICSMIMIPVIETGQGQAELNIQNQQNFNEKQASSNMKLVVYICDKYGQFEKNVVSMSKESYNSFKQNIVDISNLDKSLVELFEEKILLLHHYGIIPNDINLTDIVDISSTMTQTLGNFSIINAKKFESNFAPIFLAGMGFGLGIGFRRMPVMKHIAGNIFSAGLIGLGAVLCLDIEDSSLYYQYTFTYPYLIHILSGFIGVMLFAFDSLFPPENGPPITIYSNFFALGMAGLAIGFELELPSRLT